MFANITNCLIIIIDLAHEIKSAHNRQKNNEKDCNLISSNNCSTTISKQLAETNNKFSNMEIKSQDQSSSFKKTKKR